tara:strand:+ start:2024 stop:3160 length:1137 start_codon:yes stop_codon:yes gene_type:complete
VKLIIKTEKKLIKIGIVCYPTFGGSGVVATELGIALSNNNFQVHFISYEKPVRLNHLNEKLIFHKVKVPNYPLFKFPPYELALTTKIVELVESESIEVLHVHYAIPHAYAAVSAKKILQGKGYNIPIITTLHGTDITLLGNQPSVRSVINYSINESDIVTVVSENLKKETIKNFEIHKEIKVIPNFIDINKLNLNTKKPSSNTKVLTHISNFRPVKRVLDVINIFKIIDKNIDCKLFMIGDGPEKVSAEKLVNEYNLDNKVFFLGNMNDIEEVLIKTDLFLLPSESESFGLVALEAMAYSIPVLTTNKGGITEVVDNNQNGFTINVGNVTLMAEKAITILNNNKIYSKFSKKAFDKAMQFDIVNILPMYESEYFSLLK